MPWEYMIFQLATVGYGTKNSLITCPAEHEIFHRVSKPFLVPGFYSRTSNR